MRFATPCAYYTRASSGQQSPLQSQPQWILLLSRAHSRRLCKHLSNKSIATVCWPSLHAIVTFRIAQDGAVGMLFIMSHLPPTGYTASEGPSSMPPIGTTTLTRPWRGGPIPKGFFASPSFLRYCSMWARRAPKAGSKVDGGANDLWNFEFENRA